MVKKKSGDLEDFWIYPKKNKCVWVSTETGLDAATPKHGLWLLLRQMLSSYFDFLNFCVVWVFVIGKLKSGENNRGVCFCHTPSKFLNRIFET